MELFQRLELLSRAGNFDVCAYASVSLMRDVYQAKSRGRGMTMLKTLLSNACERDCFYCPFRKSRDTRRTRLTPDEMAKAFVQLYSQNVVQGLFLSSAIRKNPVFAQDQLLATAEILRFRYGFKGYLHIKIMPGADQAQIERSLRLANRVSVNLEAPNDERLSALSPDKSFNKELAAAAYFLKRMRDAGFDRVSQTTQLVVGPAGESDLELLQTSHDLYRNMGLARVYYSGFRPVRNTPFEDRPPENPMRIKRLYQADFLVRDYGLKAEDLVFDSRGRLPVGLDPKTAWAQQHPEHFPVDLHKADYHQLILVPGIGPKTARKIIKHRWNNVLSPKDLVRLGLKLNRARPFIVIRGKSLKTPTQISLF